DSATPSYSAHYGLVVMGETENSLVAMLDTAKRLVLWTFYGGWPNRLITNGKNAKAPEVFVRIEDTPVFKFANLERPTFLGWMLYEMILPYEANKLRQQQTETQ